MDDLYDATPIPNEAELSAAFATHDRAALDDGINLDLSAHSSTAATVTSSCASSSSGSSSSTDGEREQRRGKSARQRGGGGTVGGGGASRGQRKMHEVRLDSRAVLMAKLTRLVSEEQDLLSRVEAVKERHSRSDFVAGERCANSGCAVVGLRKFTSRIACESANARRALERLQQVSSHSQDTLGVCGDSTGVAAELAAEDGVEAAKAQQIVDCSSLGHLQLVMRCLESESDVVGVCVPLAAAPAKTHSQEGPASCGDDERRASRHGSSHHHHHHHRAWHVAAAAGRPFAESRLEIDVVSANGLRWIKVRTAVPSSADGPASDAAVLSPSDCDLVQMMGEYVHRARAVKFAFGERVQVAILFSLAPPPVLANALAALGVCVGSADGSARMDPTHCSGSGKAAAAAAAAAFFSPIKLIPSFICLDTTALVCLCSETCFPSELAVGERERNLGRYKVLSDQIRSEAHQPAVQNGGVVEETLREFTTWGTLTEFAQKMQRSLLEPSRGMPEDCDEAWRRTYKAVAVSIPDTQWCDRVPGKGSSVAEPVESVVICHVDAERERRRRRGAGAAGTGGDGGVTTMLPEDEPRPNWIVADVSYHEFRWMVETIAGRSEARRAKRLLRNVLVVDTTFLRQLPAPCAELAAKGHVVSCMQYLQPSAKVQWRNRVVFSCADALRAVTLTANKRVVNSAREHAIHIWCRLHPSRSLTELYMHGERRHEGPTKPPPFYGEAVADDFHSV